MGGLLTSECRHYRECFLNVERIPYHDDDKRQLRCWKHAMVFEVEPEEQGTVISNLCDAEICEDFQTIQNDERKPQSIQDARIRKIFLKKGCEILRLSRGI